MADPMAAQDNSWKTDQFRSKVVAQIEDAIRQSGNPMTKSSVEMEKHVFQRANTREDYLALVARLIIHVRENFAKKQAQQQQQQQQQGGGGMGMQPQDPINALTNLTRGSTMPPQGMAPGGQQPLGPPPPPGMNQMATAGQAGPGGQPPQMGMNMMQQQQQRPFQTYQGPMPPQQQQPMQQQQQQQQMPGQWVPNMPRADFMQQQRMSSNIGMTPQGHMMGGQQRPDNFMPPIMQQQQQPHMHPMQQGSPQVHNGQAVMSSGQGMHLIPDNITSSSGNLLLPSPGQPASMGLAPSPASRALASIPSPSMPLNTPVNPGSMNHAPSPAAGGATDDTAYMEKWKQLQKYIEPLKRMINRIVKDEDRKIDLNKMTNLLNILSDSSQRLPMQTLLKCEQALERLDLQSKTGGGVPSVPTPVTAVSKAPEAHICQPLYEAVAAQINNPLLNHTLQRTFGPAMQVLNGGIDYTPPAPKRLRTASPPKDENDIPDMIQGEIARLDGRFRVEWDPLHKRGSKTLRFLCKIDDNHLPSVPALCFTVPEQYPRVSPLCHTVDTLDYDGTAFLKRVKKLLRSQLESMSSTHSISSLLDAWEMSIRKGSVVTD